MGIKIELIYVKSQGVTNRRCSLLPNYFEHLLLLLHLLVVFLNWLSFLATLHALHRCGLLLQMSQIAWYVRVSVCLSVGHRDAAEIIKMPFGWLTRMGSINHILDVDEIPMLRGNHGEMPGQLKSIESLCCSMCGRRDHSIVNNGTTCDTAFHQSSLTTCLELPQVWLFSPIKTFGIFRTGCCMEDVP